MNNAIKVENLSKSYGKLTAVDAISFSVQKGTVFGLLGSNGAGKTTAIECILGTKVMDHGNVEILGMSPFINRKQLFEKVGVQFQESNYQENIRVGELCEVTASLYNHPEDFNELLMRFGLVDNKKSLVKELSGGQRQRLFIILALISNPEVVFLDELTTGLDVRARREVWQILKDLKNQGLTILLSSHFMDEVETLCDEICILSKGKAIFKGSIEEAVFNSPYERFEDAYLWYTDKEDDINEIL